jgi:hypothetical protein
VEHEEGPTTSRRFSLLNFIERSGYSKHMSPRNKNNAESGLEGGEGYFKSLNDKL